MGVKKMKSKFRDETRDKNIYLGLKLIPADGSETDEEDDNSSNI